MANIEMDPRPSIEQGPKPIEKLQNIQLTHDVLTLCAKAKPMAQKKRKTGGERRVAMEHEMAKLREAGFIREFELREAIKSQALVNFVTEMVSVPKEDLWWTLYVDKSSNLKGGGGIISKE
ncbi:hypothetical protein CR513_54319, partial [Mucuna pruriens]